MQSHSYLTNLYYSFFTRTSMPIVRKQLTHTWYLLCWYQSYCFS